MNTFFRICIYICFILIIFNLTWAFVDSLEVFTGMGAEGVSDEKTTSVIGRITGLDSGMVGLWGLATGIGIAGAIVVGAIIRSAAPLGIFIFADVFWVSYNGTLQIINIGGWAAETGFTIIATVCIALLFIAAVIGMLTGSG